MINSISIRYIFSKTRGYPHLEIRSILNMSFKSPIRFTILCDGFDLSVSHGVRSVFKLFLLEIR